MTHTQSMRYAMVDPKLIRANPWNTNIVSHENEVKLRASIERNGMFKPVLVRETSSFPGARDVILQSLGGWHRVEQAIELGLPEIPTIILSGLSDERAKEISLADNARYGIDDTLKLTELLGELDATAIESILPWSTSDIAALTASLAIDVEDLDLDEPVIPDPSDTDQDPAPTKTARTHQVLRFRSTVADAARIAELINRTKVAQGFTAEDDLTNAGDALAFLLFRTDEDDDAAS